METYHVRFVEIEFTSCVESSAQILVSSVEAVECVMVHGMRVATSN